MKRHLASWVLTCGLFGSVCAQSTDQPVDVEKEARLQKPITAHLKLVSLPAALKELSKESGVPLESANSMAKLKVTVLVKEVSAGLTLARLADLFHAEWKASGDGYRISVPNEWTSREASYVTLEDKERRKDAEATIRGLMDGASIPYASIADEIQSGRAKGEHLQNLKRSQSAGQYLLGSMFNRLSSAEWKEFWQGRTMRMADFLPDAPPKSNGDPKARQQGVRTGIIMRDDPPPGQKPTETKPAGTKVRVSATFDPITGRLRTNEDAGASVVRMDALITKPFPDGDLAKTPFGREVLAWMRIEDDNEALKASLSGVPPAGEYFRDQSSMADLLAWLHDKTGVPVVADAFRTPMRSMSAAPNIATWLRNLVSSNGAFVRTTNGFVMVRHGAFWRLREWEIPEERFAAIEKSKTPTLDAYADFAGSLSLTQAAPFRFNAVLTRFDPTPLRNAMTPLRFYSTLSAAERKAAISGSRLPFARLSGASREQFLMALDDQMGTTVGNGVDDLQGPDAASALGFLLSASTAERDSTGASINGRSSVGAAFRMLFGVSRTDGVQFMLPVG